MKKKGKVINKTRATKRLYLAVINYIEAYGGTALVVSGVETIQWPDELKYNYRLAIRVTGKKPKPEQSMK